MPTEPAKLDHIPIVGIPKMADGRLNLLRMEVEMARFDLTVFVWAVVQLLFPEQAARGHQGG